MELTKEYLLDLKRKLLSIDETEKIEDYLPKESAYQFLLNCNKKRMDRVAINYLGRKISYNSLFEKIDNCAKSFVKLGVKKGDVVAIAMLSTPEAIISFYALNKIGAIAFMINATHDKPLIKEELEDSKAKILVINDIIYDKDIMDFTNELNYKSVITSSLDESLPYGFVGDKIKFKIVNMMKRKNNMSKKDDKCINWSAFEKIGKSSLIHVEINNNKNSGAVIASTSGSTGKAKRPLLTNENLNSIPIQMGMTCPVFLPGDSIFTTLPPWILYSLFNSIHEPLCLGVTVDLDPLFDSKKIHKRLKQYRFNHWNTIPGYVEDMVADKKMNNMDCSFLKSITTGGDYRTPKLKAEAEEKLKSNNSFVEIGQGYGASECGGCFCYSYEKGMPAETIGKPLFGNEFKIIDQETGEKLGPNMPGILYLYSPTMMKEYYGNQELTDRVFSIDENGKKWYKTDDIAHYDEHGQLFMDGRIRRIELSKDSNGQPVKVFPDKIKQIILKHPLVEKCEIVMIPDEERITIPIAYIVMKEGYQLTKEVISEINDICLVNNVESYMYPLDFVAIDSIPKKKSLKVDIDQLKDMYLNSKCDNAINTLKKKRSF